MERYKLQTSLPGRQVLKAEISDQAPLPQALMPATLNLYAVPGCSSSFLERVSSFCKVTQIQTAPHFITTSYLQVNFRLLQISIWKIIARHGAGGSFDDSNVKPGGFFLPVINSQLQQGGHQYELPLYCTTQSISILQQGIGKN